MGTNPSASPNWAWNRCFLTPAARAVVANADSSRAGERLGRLTAVETSGFVAGPVVGAFINEIWGLKGSILDLLMCAYPDTAKLDEAELLSATNSRK